MSKWARFSALVAGAAAVVATAVLTPLAGITHAADFADPLVLVPGFWAAGAVAFAYRPQLLCARLLYLAGTLIAVGHALAATPAVAHAPGLWPINLLSQLTFVAGFAAWAVALALFPDGKLETRLEKIFTTVVALAACILPTFGFFSAPRQDLIGVVSQPATPVPIWSKSLAPLHSAAQLVPATVLLGVLLLIFRYRRSTASRRDQIRWPLAAAAVAAVSVVSSAPIAWLLGDTAQAYVFVLAVATLPAALMLGMFRDGLFGIDRLLLRSLVYGTLWVAIAAIYATAAGLLGLAAGRRLALAPAMGIAILAAMLFQPARDRLERWADRWVYGHRLSDHEAMRRLGSALEQAGDLHDIATVIASTVKRGLRCEWTLVRRADADGDGAVLAVEGRDAASDAVPDLVAPIRHAGEIVGWIECGSPRSTVGADLALLEDLARQVAPALHNADLNRRLAERLGELSASRARLVRAEETERRRIERDLHDGVQAQLVAVAAKVDLARLQLTTNRPQVPATLDELADAIRNAHLDLRELVRGIHPAALEDHGLVRAIEDRTAALPVKVTVEASSTIRESRLPAHLEGAAYFFAIEGVMNVVRHAGVCEAIVRVSQDQVSGDVKELRIEIADQGRGFCAATVTSHGLRGLADRLQALGGRLDITSAPGAGTLLVGVLPFDGSDARRG